MNDLLKKLNKYAGKIGLTDDAEIMSIGGRFSLWGRDLGSSTKIAMKSLDAMAEKKFEALAGRLKAGV